jgi:hypothetical protein
VAWKTNNIILSKRIRKVTVYRAVVERALQYEYPNKIASCGLKKNK